MESWRGERLLGEVDDDDGVFATREEDDGALKLCRYLAEYVDALRLQFF